MTESILEMLQVEGQVQLVCANDFSIAHAAVIKEELLRSLKRTGNETLILTESSVIDVTGIQLAFSWKKALQAQGRKAEVLLPTTEAIKDLLVKTGITNLF